MKTQLELHTHGNTTIVNCIHVFEDNRFSSISRYLQYIILTICSLFISSANVLLIVGLRKTNVKLTLSKKLFMYLSVSDLFTGVVTVPYQLMMAVLASDASCFMVSIQSFLNVFTPGVAMFTILSVSVARYVSVVKPTLFRQHAHSPKVFVLMVAQCLISLAIALWYATATSPMQLGLFLISVTFFCFGLIGVSVILNVCMYHRLNRNATENTASKQIKKREYHKQVTKTLIIISLILTICYLPNGIVFAVVGYYVFTNDPRQTMYNYYIPWVYLPIVLNAGLNSSVYMWRDKKILNYYLNRIRGSISSKELSLKNGEKSISYEINQQIEESIDDTMGRSEV